MFVAMIKKISKTSSLGLIFSISIVVLAYLSYVFPMIYAYFESVNFIYVNAWDEETYLSYQGAHGSLSIPGYWTSGGIVYALQNLGFSGGEINIIFDCLLTPVTFSLIFFILRYLKVESSQALIYGVVILFSPILFNFGNPLLSGFTREYGILGYGWEYYQSALRTPEPQLSYFFVVLAVAGYLKTRKISFLFAVVPLLYFYVGVPYAYFLVSGLILLYSKFIERSLDFLRVGIICIISYLVVSIGFIVFDFLFLSKDVFITGIPQGYIKTHVPVFPVSAGLMFFFLLVERAILSPEAFKKSKQVHAQLYVAISIFFICNLHMISGVMLSYKNYLDYSTGLIAGVGIVIFLDFLRCHSIKWANAVCFVSVSLILYLTFKAYGFSFSAMEYNFFRGLQFNSIEEYEAATDDPMSTIIQDSDLAAKLPYSVPKMTAPLFSYQYNYPMVANGCRSVLQRMEFVVGYLKSNPQNVPLVNFQYLEASIKAFSGQKYVPLELQKNGPDKKSCKIINPEGSFRILDYRYKDNGWLRVKLF
ncbi:hypothetical protein [Pseudomonas sp. Root562]|uniref:hypothetical protein n=1 Tax=Pseudomonas sp. Root562 TaxID=1736561 RepID=UPI00070316D2|nr:hypothetical protein [Pseudomonas sp. Root562]KQZ78528.1 hypothetical protein ASD60_16425 [Pseudomonas sp. Root562]